MKLTGIHATGRSGYGRPRWISSWRRWNPSTTTLRWLHQTSSLVSR